MKYKLIVIINEKGKLLSTRYISKSSMIRIIELLEVNPLQLKELKLNLSNIDDISFSIVEKNGWLYCTECRR